MKRFIAFLAILMCLGCAAAREQSTMTAADLLRCEYSIFGGMANASSSMAMERETRYEEAILTVVERFGSKTTSKAYPTSWRALEELNDFIKAYAPEGWADLPRSELEALDAPTECITLVYADDTVYAISDDREFEGDLFRDVYAFLESYAASGAQTFEVPFGADDGGGPGYRATLSDPSRVWVEVREQGGAPHAERAPSSEGEEFLVFHGRIPGRVEVTIEANGDPQVPVTEKEKKVYVLEVDGEYNVSCVEEAWR